MANAPVAQYGAGDPFPKPIVQTHFETVGDVEDSEYSQAQAIAITSIVGIGLWVVGLLYILVAVVTHGGA